MLLATSAWAGDQVFHLTAHGNSSTGVNRLAGVAIGHCKQCHPVRQSPAPMSPVLFTTNDNALCFTCHQATGVAQVYLGQTSYAGSLHATSSAVRWPGPTPPARPAGDAGFCLNCHTPHGARDGQGLVPSLVSFREEALCLSCHDASGPATTNIAAELAKSGAHPTVPTSAVHLAAEGSVSTAFGTGKRHAECTDCHNPHVANASSPLAGTSRLHLLLGALLFRYLLSQFRRHRLHLGNLALNFDMRGVKLFIGHDGRVIDNCGHFNDPLG